jgi:glycosyltransferase involved in cell wall biosynthesis
MISIVLPLYNKDIYIKDTVTRVLKQTFQKFELIIVNDGSTDKSASIVQEFDDPRIILINQENKGVSSARNRGISEAKYKYIAFLDADDKWSNNHLEELYKLICDFGEQADAFVTNFARTYPDGTIVNNRKPKELHRGIIKNYFKTILKKGVIHTSAVCIKKNALDDIGLFKEGISYGEDIDLWNRIARKYKIAYSPVVTEFYQIGTMNNASNIKNYDKVAANYIKLTDSINIFDLLFNLMRLLKIKAKMLILK